MFIGLLFIYSQTFVHQVLNKFQDYYQLFLATTLIALLSREIPISKGFHPGINLFFKKEIAT
jgi:hypothetical protein